VFNSGMQDVYLSQTYILNEGSLNENVSWQFAGSNTETTSYALTSTTSLTAGDEISTEFSTDVEIPLIAKASVKFGFKTSFQLQKVSTTTTTYQNQQAMNWLEGSLASSGGIMPGWAKNCSASTVVGKWQHQPFPRENLADSLFCRQV
jgi:hypothetical protein